MVIITPNTEHLLNKKVEEYNNLSFIALDPISIPHQFSKKQDIEIAGLLAATLAWGNRPAILKSCKKLLEILDNDPYNFVCNANLQNPSTIKSIFSFKHRTFNGEDAMAFLRFFQHHYKINKQDSLQTAFTKNWDINAKNVEQALSQFHRYFFDIKVQGKLVERTKHVSAPFKKSACKKLNMFLRWMVRNDKAGVDFGLWKTIKPHQLIIPLDVHVMNIAINLKLLPENAKPNWQTAVQLTNCLKQLDCQDPIKYDYALFSMGIESK